MIDAIFFTTMLDAEIWEVVMVVIATVLLI
jgi:hypothetical protein